MDIVPASVETTNSVLARYALTNQFRTLAGSVFAMPFKDSEQFDVVYSWGVLYHTGNMWEAIDKALHLVRPGGEPIIAIYLKTRSRIFVNTEKTAA